MQGSPLEDIDFNLLFWNLGLNNNPELIRECIEYTNADIALFAEWGQLDTVALSAILPDDYRILPTMFDDAKILAVIKSSIELINIQEQTRYVVYSLSHLANSMFLLESIFKINILTHMTLPVVLRLKICSKMLGKKGLIYQVRKQLSLVISMLSHTMKYCERPTFLMPYILKRLYRAKSIALGNAAGTSICIVQCFATIPKMARNTVHFTVLI